MLARMRPWILGLFSALLLSACPSSDTSDSTPSGGAGTATQAGQNAAGSGAAAGTSGTAAGAGGHAGITNELGDAAVLDATAADASISDTTDAALAADSGGPIDCDPRIAAKMSLVLATRHEHGALVRCLNALADEGLNLTKLESRPRPGMPWEYVFYVDFEGHVKEPRVQAALTALAERTLFVKLLGCYPVREIPSAEGRASRV